MTSRKQSLVAAALFAAAAPALAHEFECDAEVALVATDAAGAPIVGQSGLPVLEPGILGASLFHYPATIGVRIRVRNTAPDTSIVKGAWSTLQDHPAVAWYGDAFSAGRAFAAGASGQTVAVARVEDEAACRALRGPGLACGEAFQSRFVITHDAGSAECRVWLRCRPNEPLPPAPSWRVSSGTDRDLTGVWASGPDDAWAVGAGGVILHWDGLAWVPVASGTTEDLTAVWGTSAGDVWVTGRNVVLHWDGTTWSVRRSDVLTFRGVWGSGPDDVWVSSEYPLFHWNGAGWERFELPEVPDGFFAIWGSSAEDVWAGGAGVMAHWTGSGGWELVSLPEPYRTLAVWGWAPGTFFAGAPALLYRFADGERVDGQHSMSAVFHGLWGASAEDVWAVGTTSSETSPAVYHWDGNGWRWVETAATGGLAAVGGTAASDHLWIVGQRGEIVRYARR